MLELLEPRRLFSGQPMLNIGDAHVVEGNDGATHAEVVVSLSKSRPKQAVTVHYATQNDTASAGVDYLAASGKLTFSAGETSKTIRIPVIGDRVAEQHEYFFVDLKSAKNAKIADGQGMIEVIDDEPRIVVHDASAPEGSSGATPLAFTVSLLTPYDVPVSVNYATTDGSAIAGSDYAASAGTVTFQPGETTQTIPLLMQGDRLVEPNETFFLNLSNPSSYAEIIQGSAIGTVIDDDEVRISIADVSGEDGATSITFTVSLSAPSDEVVTVNFATADGTATAGVDYTATSGTVTFPPGETTQTIIVEVLAPTSAPDKWFAVNLSSASANAAIVDEQAYGFWYYDYGDPGCGCYDYGYYGYYDYGYYDYYGGW